MIAKKSGSRFSLSRTLFEDKRTHSRQRGMGEDDPLETFGRSMASLPSTIKTPWGSCGWDAEWHALSVVEQIAGVILLFDRDQAGKVVPPIG